MSEPINNRLFQLLSAIEQGIDRAVSIIDPQAAIKRAGQRDLLNKRAMYASAKTTRSTGEWLAVNTDINSITRSDLQTLRDRARQLTRDFPYFERAINILTTYKVGTGHQ